MNDNPYSSPLQYEPVPAEYEPGDWFPCMMVVIGINMIPAIICFAIMQFVYPEPLIPPLWVVISPFIEYLFSVFVLIGLTTGQCLHLIRKYL